MTPIEVGNLLSERLGVRWSVQPGEPVSYFRISPELGSNGDEVVWNVKDGLTALLREFGHAKRRAWFGPPNEADALETINKDPIGFAAHRIEEEIAASLEAEQFAHELGLPFDYKAAEDALPLLCLHARGAAGDAPSGRAHPAQVGLQGWRHQWVR